MEEQHVVPQPAFTPAVHPILSELDGRAIRSGSRHWIVSVIGLHVNRHGEWVQLQLDGSEGASVILLLRPPATSAKAVAALERYDPAKSPHIIVA